MNKIPSVARRIAGPGAISLLLGFSTLPLAAATNANVATGGDDWGHLAALFVALLLSPLVALFIRRGKSSRP